MGQKETNTSAEVRPGFSIVIPTYQRSECLRNCLSGIAALTTPRSEFEVIIVDDCSDKDPAGVVDPFKSDLQVQLIYQKNRQGPAAARNRGARHARGEYLLFLDDDCIPSRNWLETIDKHLGNSDKLAVGGNCLNGLGDRMYSEAQQMLMDYLYSYYNSDPARAQFCPTNNLAVPRQSFLELGGFDTSFRKAAGEDREFSTRWIRSGANLTFVTDAPVYHQHAMGLKEFLRMHYCYGRGARRYHRREAGKKNEQGLEPINFYTGLIFFPFSQTTVGRATALSLLQVLSQVAHTCGYLRELPLTR